MPFEEQGITKHQDGIPFNFAEYLKLLDWTGSVIRSDKYGHIDRKLPPILRRFHIEPEQWRLNTTQFETLHPKRFNRIVPQLDTG